MSVPVTMWLPAADVTPADIDRAVARQDVNALATWLADARATAEEADIRVAAAEDSAGNLQDALDEVDAEAGERNDAAVEGLRQLLSDVTVLQDAALAETILQDLLDALEP